MADTTTRFAKETAQVHKRFDIDKSETVITHYACAHKGRVLKQGRLYISQNYLCFYAQIVGKTHKKTINFSDVSDLSKANFGVFPNAIKITTRKNKEILFTSFLMRDQAYDAIRQQWLCLSSRIDCSQNKEKEHEKEHEKEKTKKEKKEKKEKKAKRSSKSLSPSGADQCSESESDKETEKKKKKKRWSLTKKKSDADSMNSDSDIGSDVSSNRRASTCSTSSLDRHATDSAPSTPTSNTVRRASCSAAPVSTPFSLSTPSASPSASPSLSSSVPPSPSSRGDRAQALLDSGAFVPVPLELSTVNNSVHNDGTSQAGDHPSETAPPTLWQKMCSCF